jgi:hypothetical protein
MGRFEVVTTVRSQQKGDKILEAYPKLSREQLSYVIVEDIAKEGAFDEVCPCIHDAHRPAIC